MKRALFALAIAGCSAAYTPPSIPHQRAALVHMIRAEEAAARQCTGTAQWLARGGQRFMLDPGAQADRLAELCIKAIIPARDALYQATQAADPWSAESSERIACAARAVGASLETIRGALVVAGSPIPETMRDGLTLAAELSDGSTCDPRYPTTTVTVLERPR